jgi:hypothetical protein
VLVRLNLLDAQGYLFLIVILLTPVVPDKPIHRSDDSDMGVDEVYVFKRRKKPVG